MKWRAQNIVTDPTRVMWADIKKQYRQSKDRYVHKIKSAQFEDPYDILPNTYIAPPSTQVISPKKANKPKKIKKGSETINKQPIEPSEDEIIESVKS